MLDDGWHWAYGLGGHFWGFSVIWEVVLSLLICITSIKDFWWVMPLLGLPIVIDVWGFYTIIYCVNYVHINTTNSPLTKQAAYTSRFGESATSTSIFKVSGCLLRYAGFFLSEYVMLLLLFYWLLLALCTRQTPYWKSNSLHEFYIDRFNSYFKLFTS